MNWNDYEVIWKRQTLPAGAPADVTELGATFEAKRRKQAATLLVRDWSEIAACVFLIGVYLHFWRQIGAAGRPMALAILLVAGLAGFFLRERLRSRRLRLGADAPLLAKVEADLAELRHQHRLLSTVWLWYIAPCVGAVLIHVGVMINHGQPWRVLPPVVFPWVAAGFAFVIALLVGGMVWFVSWINRRAVRTQIEPRIAELEKLHQDLLATP